MLGKLVIIAGAIRRGPLPWSGLRTGHTVVTKRLKTDRVVFDSKLPQAQLLRISLGVRKRSENSNLLP